MTSLWLKWIVNQYDIVVSSIAREIFLKIVLVKGVSFNDSESKYYEPLLSAHLLAPFIKWQGLNRFKKNDTIYIIGNFYCLDRDIKIYLNQQPDILNEGQRRKYI